jgi:hypothetical protein
LRDAPLRFSSVSIQGQPGTPGGMSIHNYLAVKELQMKEEDERRRRDLATRARYTYITGQFSPRPPPPSSSSSSFFPPHPPPPPPQRAR